MSADDGRSGGDPATSRGNLSAPLAAALVLVASGAVLVLEILADGLLAPYVGPTLETTTAIIGAALAGIAVGRQLAAGSQIGLTPAGSSSGCS